MAQSKKPQFTERKQCFLNMHRTCSEYCAAFYEKRCIVIVALNSIAINSDKTADAVAELTRLPPPTVR